MLSSLGAHPLFRLVHNALRGGGCTSSRVDAALHRDMTTQAYWLVRCFYLFSLTVAFQSAIKIQELGQPGNPPTPLWPLQVMSFLGIENLTLFTIAGLLLSAVLCILLIHARYPRVLLAFFTLMSTSYESSFGGVNHHLHIWFWVSVMLAMMPVGPLSQQLRSFTTRHVFLSAYFAAMALVAFFYTQSGLHKARFGIIWDEGAMSSFHPDALTYLATNRWLHNAYPTVLQDLYMENRWIGWPGHLFVVYIELFALLALFRPEMHRLFGFLLMSFHMGVWLLLGIPFPYQPMTLAMLFVWSPFAALPRHGGLGAWLRSLPLFGDAVSLVRWLRRRKKPQFQHAAH